MTSLERDILLVRIDERQQAMNDKQELMYDEIKKTNGRVTALEAWRHTLRGAWAVILIASGTVATLASILFNYFN